MDALIEPVGPFGGFQKVNLFIVGCVTMLTAMYHNMIIINYFEPDITCYSRTNSSTVIVANASSKCDMWHSYTESLETNIKLPYICKVNNETYGLNVVSEWNLVCQNSFIATITQSLYLIGTLCAFITELVVDKYGRRKASVIFILSLISTAFVCQALVSDMKMLSVKDPLVKFIVYTISQLALGVLVYCLSSSTYMHLIELTTSGYHHFFSNVNTLCFLLGEVVSLGIYFFTLDWKVTNWFFILFGVITFAMFNFFVLESPRWLIESAQYEDAYEILKKMARFNKKKTLDNAKFKDYTLKQMQSNLNDKSRENSDLEDQLENLKKTEAELREITFTQKVCLPKENFYKIALLIILFNCMSLNFFGASLSIVNATQINNFLIVLLSSICGFIGAFFCGINEKIGYKTALLSYLFFSGLTSFLVAVIPEQDIINWVVITKAGFALFGKAVIVAAYNSAITYAAESYDLKIKVNLIVLLNCAGCIMTIAAPQINFLRVYWQPLPYIVYTTTAIVSFFIVNHLPEPRNLQKKKNLNYM